MGIQFAIVHISKLLQKYFQSQKLKFYIVKLATYAFSRFVFHSGVNRQINDVFKTFERFK